MNVEGESDGVRGLACSSSLASRSSVWNPNVHDAVRVVLSTAASMLALLSFAVRFEFAPRLAEAEALRVPQCVKPPAHTAMIPNTA